MDLLDLQRNVRKINVNKMMNRAVLENKEEILDLNTAQLSKGKNKFGEFLQEYALDAYAKYKKFLGSEAPLGIPNLYLEGNFYEGWFISEDGENWNIFSSDEKADELANKYGIDIFGLSEESLAEIRPAILESIQNQIRYELLR